MLVTNRRATLLPLVDVIRAAVQGGVDAIQIRERDCSEDQLAGLIHTVLDAACPAAVIVNGSIGLARRFNTGVHLPENGPTIADARAALGHSALIGRSVHTPESAAASRGADYLLAGHVFSSRSKPGLPPIGLDGLAAIAGVAAAPVMAIGGINEGNARTVFAYGAQGVAIMSEINQAADPKSAAVEIKSSIETAGAEISITLNGREARIAEGLTIGEFLSQRGFKGRLVVVELNGKIAPKNSYSSRVFEPEDRVEIVHFVGGG